MDATRPFRLTTLMLIAASGAAAGQPGPANSETLGNSMPAAAEARDSELNRFREYTRSPAGLLYPDLWYGLPQDLLRDGHNGGFAIEAGFLSVSGDDRVASFNEYGDWRQGVMLSRMRVASDNPATDRYLYASAADVGRDDQSYRLTFGQYGRYSVRAAFDGIPHNFSTNARILWDGAGTGNLTLPAGVPPATASLADVQAAFAAIGNGTLALQRNRYGLALRITPHDRLDLYADATTEDRDGTRAFGGAFSYPGLGQVMETVEPIDYATTNFSAGLSWRGSVNQVNVRYSGSLFRNDTESLTWENPGLATFAAFVPEAGRMALAPDNDYHHLKADYGRTLGFWRGRLTATASWSRMSQDADLLAPTISSGTLNAAGLVIDLDQWNTTDALSQATADATMSQALGQVQLTLSPTRNLRLAGKLRVLDQDNDTDYLAYNPQTGQYGYIALDGGLAGIIPRRSAVYDPNLPGSRVRIRNTPYEKDSMEAEFGADYRLGSQTRLAAAIRRETYDYAFRERSEVEDDILELSLVRRGLLRGTLHLAYEIRQRDGDDYVPNPYDPFYSASLAGYDPRFPDGDVPHTLSAMRKYDLSSRDTNLVKARFLLAPTDASSIVLSGRLSSDDYDADYGLLDAETLNLNAEWSYQAGLNSTLVAWYSYQAHERSMANINDAGPAGTDADAGGVVYPLDRAWSESADETNHSAGGGYTRVFTRWSLDVQYSFTRSESQYDYEAASPAAYFNAFPPDEVGTGFPQQSFELHILELSGNWQIRDDVGMRVYYRYEKEDLDDFHYRGLVDPVAANTIYLAAVPENFSNSAVGVFVEKTFH